MTDAPLSEFESSLSRLSLLAKGTSPKEQHAIKLIRLAAEILVSDLPPAATGTARLPRQGS